MSPLVYRKLSWEAASYTHTYIYIFIYCIYIYLQVHVYSLFLCIYIYIFCMCIYTGRMHACTHIYIYIYISFCTCLYQCVAFPRRIETRAGTICQLTNWGRENESPGVQKAVLGSHKSHIYIYIYYIYIYIFTGAIYIYIYISICTCLYQCVAFLRRIETWAGPSTICPLINWGREKRRGLSALGCNASFFFFGSRFICM